MDKIIEMTGLKKAYKDVQAVRGVDFYAERGKPFALFGPNGAARDCERETPQKEALRVLRMPCPFRA